MRAAIYARKSNEQDGLAEEDKSVGRQIEHARAYAERKGWVVADEHVYIDDGVSGAEFANRPGFMRLMNAVAHRTFQVLILSESSRLGRESFETGYALKRILSSGVRLFFYLEDRECTFTNPTDKLMFSMLQAIDELERARASQRVTDKMHHLFEAGHVTGCKVFGYDNVPVNGFDEHGLPKKGPKRRVVNEHEAAVVREIFALAARGVGLRGIAHELNERGVPSPRAQRGRPSGWDPGTIRAVLGRPIYRGEVVYNLSRKCNLFGEKQQRQRPQTDWKSRQDEDLRIIDDRLADAVDALRLDRRTRYLRAANGKLIGRPPTGAKHLLSGWLTCACGARFEALKGGNWSHKGAVYVCAARRRKGPKACTHNFAFPIDVADNMILDVIEGELLSPASITFVLDSAIEHGPDRAVLKEERERVAREIENLTKAIAAADGEIPVLVSVLKERDRRLRHLDAELTAEPPDREKLRLALEQRVSDWRAILRGNKKQARMVLQQLVEPIRLEGTERPSWMAETKPHGLLVGIGTFVASPTGFEPVFQP